MQHYLHPNWVSPEKLSISAFDLTVMRGFGIFDFLRTYKHQPFRLQPHIDRLFNSASQLGIQIPLTASEIANLVQQGLTLNADQADDFNLRLIVTGGVGPDSLTPGNPQFIIIYEPAHDYPQEFYTQGVKVITHQHDRIFPRAKSLNYLTAIVTLQQAKAQGALEVIYTDPNQNIYEGTTSNFFAVIDNTLITPPTDQILNGITRQVIFELAKQLNIPLKEQPINLSQLPQLQEAFISASNKEVMPVSHINGTQVGQGSAGPITAQLITAYRHITRN